MITLHMITFVINLDEATDRWNHYKGLDVHRWRATPCSEVDIETDKKMISFHNVSRKNETLLLFNSFAC